ncbi:hypothetical protein PAV_6c01470 [Paenibacillus alvei DSM 29]|nr:hypothetical protein PAV_6c01470 [Paenibacillus alvei DSM 29]
MKKRLSWLMALCLMVTMIVPTSALAANAKADLNYAATKKAAAEKAKLLTESFGTTSVQYALIDHGKIVVSGQVGKMMHWEKFRLQKTPYMELDQRVRCSPLQPS